jgi:hypothetical protein
MKSLLNNKLSMTVLRPQNYGMKVKHPRLRRRYQEKDTKRYNFLHLPVVDFTLCKQNTNCLCEKCLKTFQPVSQKSQNEDNVLNV